MSRTRAALVIGGCLLFATWLQRPATSSPDGRNASTPAERAQAARDAEQTAQSVSPAAAQVDAEAAKLRARLAARPLYPEPARDPFRFAKSTPKNSPKKEIGTIFVAAPAPAPAVEEPVAPAVVLPTLVALTVEATDGGLMRRAALALGDSLAIVRPGQTFSHFLVRNIGPASVDVVDLTAPISRVFTISLR